MQTTSQTAVIIEHHSGCHCHRALSRAAPFLLCHPVSPIAVRTQLFSCTRSFLCKVKRLHQLIVNTVDLWPCFRDNSEVKATLQSMRCAYKALCWCFSAYLTCKCACSKFFNWHPSIGQWFVISQAVKYWKSCSVTAMQTSRSMLWSSLTAWAHSFVLSIFVEERESLQACLFCSTVHINGDMEHLRQHQNLYFTSPEIISIESRTIPAQMLELAERAS